MFITESQCVCLCEGGGWIIIRGAANVLTNLLYWGSSNIRIISHICVFVLSIYIFKYCFVDWTRESIQYGQGCTFMTLGFKSLYFAWNYSWCIKRFWLSWHIRYLLSIHTCLMVTLQFSILHTVNVCSLWKLDKKTHYPSGWLKWNHFLNSSPSSNLILHPNNSDNSQQMRTGSCGWIQITPPLNKKITSFVPGVAENDCRPLFVMLPGVVW